MNLFCEQKWVDGKFPKSFNVLSDLQLTEQRFKYRISISRDVIRDRRVLIFGKHNYL